MEKGRCNAAGVFFQMRAVSRLRVSKLEVPVLESLSDSTELNVTALVFASLLDLLLHVHHSLNFADCNALTFPGVEA